MPELFRQSIGMESLWYCAAVGGFAALRMRHAPCGYTKYNCTFHTSPCQKISRHPLLLVESELPYIIAKNRAGDNTENRRTDAKRAEIRTKIQIHRKFTAHFAVRIAESTKIWYDAGEAKGG